MVTRWVCAVCGAVWFQPQNERCPSCRGGGEFKECEQLPNGEVKPRA